MNWELKTLDARFMLRGARDDTAEVVVVGIDDVSLRTLQLQWPWPRAVHAQLVDQLAEKGVRAVVFDVLFMEPSRLGQEDDALLAEAAVRAGNVIFGQKLTRIVDSHFRTTALEQPLEALRRAGWTALVNHQPDPDAFARRSYLAMRHQDRLYPGLAAAAVAVYLGRDPVEWVAEASGAAANMGGLPPDPGVDAAPPGFDGTPPGFDGTPPGFDFAPPGFDGSPPGSVSLDAAPKSETGPTGDPAERSFDGARFPDGPRTLDANGAKAGLPSVPLIRGGPLQGAFVINFRGGVRSVRTIPYYQVLQGTVPREFLQGKIVFVGATAPDLEDHFATPFLAMGPMPGVEVHAHAAMTLLRGDGLRMPHPLATVLTIFGAAIGTAIVGSWLSAALGFLFASAAAGGLLSYSLWAFQQNLWFQMVPPLVAVTLAYTLINAYRFAVEERERRRVQHVFGRYVSQDVVDQLLATGGEVPLGGVRQEVTVMFSDIRGFTALSERLQAEDVVQLLNEYFAAMTGVVFAHQGMIDKFMGDAMMAVFGAPLPKADDALRAVRSAVGMRRRLLDLRASWDVEGGGSLDSGIGINTAEVIVGNIGSQQRMEYTVIGDGVNLAARLEELSKEYGGGILIAEGTYARVRDHVVAQPLGTVTVRGKSEPVPIYKVLGLQDDAWREEPFAGVS